MGISYQTYIGPYARCAITLVPTVDTEIACTNTACPNHTKLVISSFCALCGAPTGDVARTVLADSVDDWSIWEAINDRLTSPGGDAYYDWKRDNLAHVWLPNVSVPGLRDGYLESRVDFALIDIEPTQPSQESLVFVTHFTPELALLRERYGEDAMRIRWGVVQYYY